MARLQWIAVSVLLMFLVPDAGACQISGRVVEASNRPVAGALVELWSENRRVSQVLTDSLGYFWLSDRAEYPAGLTISVIGYRPLSLSLLKDREEPLLISLEPYALPLEEIVVTAEPNGACVADSLAVSIWERARAAYNLSTPERGMSARVLERIDRQIPMAALGWAPDDRLSPNSWNRVGATAEQQAGRFLSIESRISRHGYAFPTGLANRPWSFPPLEGSGAYHFASRLFGDLHHLEIVSQNDQRIVIRFCPAQRGKPGLDGMLVIGSDNSFVSASWIVTDLGENLRAGGEVAFAPVKVADKERHLLAARGREWHEDPKWKGSFHQRNTVFISWLVGRDSEAPGYPDQTGVRR